MFIFLNKNFSSAQLKTIKLLLQQNKNFFSSSNTKIFKVDTSTFLNSKSATNINNAIPSLTRRLFDGGAKKDSLISSHLSLFIRRQRILIRNSPLQKEIVKGAKIDSAGINRLISLAKPERFKLAGAMILLVISSTVTMAVPFFIGKLIDFVQSSTQDRAAMKEKLKKVTLAMTALFVVGSLANFGRVYIIQSTGQRIVARLRKRLFSSMMSQEMAFFDRNKTGELINRLSADAEIVGMSISQNLSDGLRSTIQAATGVGMMLYVSPALGAIGLSIVPAVTVFAIAFGRYIKNLSKQVQDVLASATEVAEEKLSNIRTVRAFAQEEKETNVYVKSVDNVMEMKLKEALAYGIFYGATGFSGNVIILSVFYFGGGYIADQVITVGDLSAFLIYSAWIGISIAGLSSFYTELMRGLGASVRIWEIIDRQPKIPIIHESSVKSVPREVFAGNIHFENVSFAYPTRPEQPILKNMNLVIPGGKICAVVGPSGSGKSTLGALLLRFYDPQNGMIRIGSLDIRNISQTTLRAQIGVVPQEPALFSASIKDNIAYGFANPAVDVTSEDIYQAAEEANAFSFIEQFPEKFDTIVGERGANLSGGQKQRIAIARAILKDPQILLLDEATSALDAASEYLVQEALESIMENRTTIIIAHRLSTIKNADLIAVLDKGHVIELGSYDELMKNDTGKFRELVARQTVDVDYTVTS